MTYSLELPLLALLMITAAGAILVKDLLSAAFILGTYSFIMALVWSWLGAVDLGFVEAVVGAGLATVFFLLALFQTDPEDHRIRRTRPPVAAIVGLPVLGLLLLFAANDLPEFGDASSPASTHVSPTYLENSMQDTRTPNVVTAIIMDYRGFDTLIETLVIFTSGIACASLLRRTRNERH
jgi:multicomponent Na+:H+ antiporter subunit B